MTQPSSSRISVVIPTYRREQVLLDTLRLVLPLLRPGDELLVVDQTPRHEPATEEGLNRLVEQGAIRWVRRNKPSQCEAMNAAAWLAKGDLLLFLDDDVVPSPNLIEAHRQALSPPDAALATFGQVLQPWDAAAVGQTSDFALGFHPAYDKTCEIIAPMTCNLGVNKQVYFDIGGMDENFFGSNYRNDAEIGYRLYRRTGCKVRFVPEASMRHLFAGGGNRAFGGKDTWGHIGGSIGDYYFALRCLPPTTCLAHCLKRFIRAPLNWHTLKHPWLIPSMFLRETVAWWRAAGRLLLRRNNYLKEAAAYL